MINVGYTSSPFGLKGEIKVITTLNHLDKVFASGNTIYINNKSYNILKSHFQGRNFLITLENYEDINKINDILKHDIYINRDDIKLEKNEYLYSDLDNLNVYSNNKLIGKVEEVLLSSINPLIRVNNVLIPLNEHYLENIDINGKIINIKNMEDLTSED